MTNEVVRNGEVFHKAVVDVYDFDQQGMYRQSAIWMFYLEWEVSSLQPYHFLTITKVDL